MISDNTLSLVFRARGNTDDAKAAFKELQKSIKKDAAQIKDDVSKSSEDTELSLNSLLGKADELTGAFGHVGTAAAAGAIAIAAVGAAAYAVGKQLFDMASKTAEAGAEIDKFQKLTSLSVATIQALKIATEQAGGSIEDIEETWESFSELMVEAARKDEDAIAKLTRNGIDHKKAIKDLEGTYMQALKIIAQMPPGLQQNAAAMDLFGESGLRMINVAKAAGGDIKVFTQRLKEQGLIMDAEGIKKAKEFNSAYQALSGTVSAFANSFALQYMPLMSNAFKDFSKYLISNKNEFVIWGMIVSDLLKTLPTILEYAGAAIKGVFVAGNEALRLFTNGLVDLMPLLNLIMPTLNVIGSKTYEDYKRKAEEYQKNSAAKSAALEANVVPAGAVTPDTKKQKEEAEKKLKEEIAQMTNLNRERIEAQRLEFEKANKANRELLESGGQTVAQFQQNTLNSLNNFSAEVGDLMREGNKRALEGKVGTERAALVKAQENEWTRFIGELNRYAAEANKTSTETAKKASEERIKISEAEATRKNEINKASTETRLRELARDLKLGAVTELEYAAAVGEIRKNAIKAEQAQLKESLDGLDKKGEKYAEITQKIKLLDEELTRQQIENTEKVAEAIENLMNAKDPGDGGREGTGSPTAAPAGRVGMSSGIEQLGGLFGELFGGENAENLELYKGLADAVTNSFTQMADAVGSAVEAFVLFGGAETSFQKFAAQMIASIAKMAAIQAIWNTAEGFAKLALAFFGHPTAGPSATQHFIAAGVYAGIAGVAAVAGRAVAGDAFRGNQTATAQNQASSNARNNSGGSVYTSNPETQMMTIGRNASQSIQQNQPTFIFKDKTSFGLDNLLAVTYENNGKFRDIIRRDNE